MLGMLCPTVSLQWVGNSSVFSILVLSSDDGDFKSWFLVLGVESAQHHFYQSPSSQKMMLLDI